MVTILESLVAAVAVAAAMVAVVMVAVVAVVYGVPGAIRCGKWITAPGCGHRGVKGTSSSFDDQLDRCCSSSGHKWAQSGHNPGTISGSSSSESGGD